MAAKTEESLISIAEKELTGFIAEKTSAETSLKSELDKAKIEYDGLVKEIQAKYNVAELEEKIKRHTYFTKLLKGEVSFPEDLEASRRKTKNNQKGNFSITASFPRVGDWNGKISAALNKIGKTVKDKPKPSDVKAALDELYPDLQYKEGSFNSAWNKFKFDDDNLPA